MTATSPLTHTGKQMADLQTRIQFLEADKRVQDLLIAARDAEIERLRGELSELITALEQHDHWLDTMPTALIKSARAELEQK